MMNIFGSCSGNKSTTGTAAGGGTAGGGGGGSAAAAAANVSETMRAINEACKQKGGAYAGYSCKAVSWDDASRGTVGGSLSCWGSNITDTRLWEKTGKRLFTVRSDNWNEKLGKISSSEVALLAPENAEHGSALRPITLRKFLKTIGKEQHGGYAGLPLTHD